MIQDEKGFTLLETLLVLTCFLIIASVTLVSLKPHYRLLNDQLFFSQLKSDLYYAQQYAISHQTEVTVIFVPNQHYYYMRDRMKTPYVIKRTYSEDISVMEGTMPHAFQFLGDGNITRFGSFLVRIGSKTFRVTFLLGRGRFYVAEE